MDTNLTIAMILATPGTGWGGMEKHTAELAAELARRGHQVHVLAHPAYQSQFSPAVMAHSLPMHLGRRNPWLRFRLQRILHSITPNVAHAQGNKAASLLGSVQRYAGARIGATVGTVHGTKTSHTPFNPLDGVIAVSGDILAALAHPNKRLIYNGLPTISGGKMTGDTIIPIPEDRPLLLAAGRLEPVKQFDRLIQAWVNARLPGALVILGEGSQRAELTELIAKLGAEDRVLLPGYEPRMRPWLKAASACAISSQREGFPYILVESLLARCPVMATPVSGVTEFLPPDCVADSDSVADLTTLIAQHLQPPHQLAERQAAAFEHAANTLTLNAMVTATEQFYQQLVPRSHSTPR
ncbi:glycosyltransferase [Marinobacter sp.]|uniref:glycosyltransferase n=1 Tax=Marinobacter sp. TaxID=50741 RepID=UPI0034A20528